MEGALLIVILLQAGFFAWHSKALVKQAQEAAAQENTRLVLLAQAALEQIAAKSVTEKVKAEALRKEYDVRLEMYRDTVAKEVEATKKKADRTPLPPDWITTDTGTKIDRNEVDWMD